MLACPSVRRCLLDLGPLLSTLAAVEPLAEAHARLDAGARVTLGANDASKAVAAALLWKRARQPALLLVARESDAEAYAEQLRAWAGDATLHFPSRSGLPYAREAPDTETARRRIATLARIARASSGAEPPLVVASAAAVAERTLRPADLGRGPGQLATGMRLSLEALALQLVEAGYEMGPLVEAPGQAARRGGLVDVFPSQHEEPVRIEFFGSEVESIRGFDPREPAHDRAAGARPHRPGRRVVPRA